MLENTLTVGRISEGFVLDHIEAGKSMEIYKYLHLDKLDCCVAIIKNAKSNKITTFARGLTSVPGLLTTFFISPYLLGWFIPRLTYANTIRIHEKQDR